MNKLNSLKNRIKDVFSKLNEPYYSSTSSLRGLLYSLVVAISVFALLTIFEPFGIDVLSNKTLAAAVCAGIAFGGMLIAEFALPAILKDYYSEQNWTMSRQIIQFFLMVILISVGILFYLGNVEGLKIDSLGIFVNILIFSIVPIFTFAFFQHSILHSKYANKAEELNQSLSQKGVISTKGNFKVLTFNASNANLVLLPNQLIYVKMMGDKSEFVYQQPLGIANATLNLLDKTVKEQLKGFPEFVTFHDDIILNANAIQKVSGNAGGFEVGIARINEHLKVANKYRKNLEQI